MHIVEKQLFKDVRIVRSLGTAPDRVKSITGPNTKRIVLNNIYFSHLNVIYYLSERFRLKIVFHCRFAHSGGIIIKHISFYFLIFIKQTHLAFLRYSLRMSNAGDSSP